MSGRARPSGTAAAAARRGALFGAGGSGTKPDADDPGEAAAVMGTAINWHRLGTGTSDEDATEAAAAAELSANSVPTSAKKSGYFRVFHVTMRENGNRPQTKHPSALQSNSLFLDWLPY